MIIEVITIHNQTYLLLHTYFMERAKRILQSFITYFHFFQYRASGHNMAYYQTIAI